MPRVSDYARSQRPMIHAANCNASKAAVRARVFVRCVSQPGSPSLTGQRIRALITAQESQCFETKMFRLSKQDRRCNAGLEGTR